MPSLKAKKPEKLTQEKVVPGTLKEVRQQYLMSRGSPPRMKIAGLFSGESPMSLALTTTHENCYFQRSIPGFSRHTTNTSWVLGSTGAKSGFSRPGCWIAKL
jgi:hypothetical protein